MIPELTASQESLPSLTQEQLKDLSIENNHLWKLNAKMMGYEEGMIIDDFIEQQTDRNIKTVIQPTQLVVSYYKGTKDDISKLPIALEGDVIIEQKYEVNENNWKTMDCFELSKASKKDTKFIRASILPHDLNGNYIIVIGSGERQNFFQPSKSQQRSKAKTIRIVSEH